MSNERMDVCVARPKKDGGVFWLKIGVFWPAKDGKPGGRVLLDALPLPDDKGVWAMSLFPVRDKPAARADWEPGSPNPRTAIPRDAPDDSIPF